MINRIIKYLKRYNGYKGRHRDPDNQRATSEAALVHWGRHRWVNKTEYHKPGATHHGSWYDQPTGLYPIIGEWA